ncbi:BON domain-containing protein [Pseudodesulfovibrio sp.]|uniref:BON domain-containing protein n=1 Tax=Pseudodesulfovibrio sp. TaxID=2035812 RepID=UPI00262E50C2|nr:BON domain-containing protein [Pseudodesulfovibrio sp.]MDD3313757.1 BON domain-containing protein [Pseudodesulfovibrio sp.]
MLHNFDALSATRNHNETVNPLKPALALLLLALLAGCAAVPFGIGLIPGAPAYVSSVIGNGQTAYDTAMDERTTRQQMLDAVVAGHAQAELYKDKKLRNNQITAHCYFGKLYLVGEYDSEEQLRNVYECMEKVKGKRMVISRLYLREDQPENDFLEEQAMSAELRAQLVADLKVTSTPVEVEIVQGDIILLGVISDKEERDRIVAHALSTHGVNRVVSYLYHDETCGPAPRVMTAKLPADATPALPARKKKSPPKRLEVRAKEAPTLVLHNPDRGR